MDIKQLQTFLTVARTLNYQKAAEQLQYAPSTLFKHIQLLEAELGVPLFCKTGRALSLTAQGSAFLEHAQSIVEHYYLALDSVRAEEKLNDQLIIGGCEINTSNSLLGLLEQFSHAYPEARISMLTSHNAGVPSLVRSEMVDVGFYYSTSDRAAAGLKTTLLYQEPVYLMVSWDHPLANRHALHYRDLTGMPFVYPHDTCCFVSEFLPKLARRGVELGKIAYLGGVHLVVEQVRQEGAMTMVPYCALERYAENYGLVKLDLAEEPVWAWEMLVYRSYEALRPAARALVRYSERYARSLVQRDSAGVLMLPDNAQSGTGL